jgi:tetratricopeptide (TPR) repeat protein
MGSTSPRAAIRSVPVRRRTRIFTGFLAVCLLGLLSVPLDAQDTGTPLAAEIQSIDGKLKDPAVSGTQRREALRRLARLLRLLGNIEGAAQIWMEAAYTDQRDDEALLEGAACFIALGEMDRAEAAIRPALLSGDRRILLRARYAAARIEAFRSGNVTAMTAFLDDPGYGDLKPVSYYTIWKISGIESYKIRLLAEFPASPEARIVREEGAVSAVPHALWLLFPGRDSVAGSRPVSVPASSMPTASMPAASGTEPGSAAASGSAPAASGDKPSALQTGLFSREENARAMEERLRAAGFTASVSRRTINGNSYWAVSVSPGTDAGHTILRLRDAGFEAFPVY